MAARTFQIDLTDPAAGGVYEVTPEDLDTVESAAAQDNFNVHPVDLAGCNDAEGITERVASAFALPPRYAKSRDALEEYLTEMDGLPSRGHVVVIRHTDAVVQTNADQLDELLGLLERTAGVWANEGIAFFTFTARRP